MGGRPSLCGTPLFGVGRGPTLGNASVARAKDRFELQLTSILIPSRSFEGVPAAVCPSSAADVADTLDFRGAMTRWQRDTDAYKQVERDYVTEKVFCAFKFTLLDSRKLE